MMKPYKKIESFPGPTSDRQEGSPHIDAEKNFKYFKEKICSYDFSSGVSDPIFIYRENGKSWIRNLDGRLEQTFIRKDPIYAEIRWKDKEGIPFSYVISFHELFHMDFKNHIDNVLSDWKDVGMVTQRASRMKDLI